MATSGELIRVISDVTGVPEEAVNWCARSLREEGLLTTGGRGRSAAKMKPSDATNILIGIMASSKVVQAAPTVSLYREASIWSISNDGVEVKVKPPFSFFEKEERTSLCIKDTFGDLLDSLLQQACENDGSIFDERTGFPVTRAEVVIWRPNAIAAEMRFWTGTDFWRVEFDRQHPYFDEKHLSELKSAASVAQKLMKDMTFSASFGSKTIEVISKALK